MNICQSCGHINDVEIIQCENCGIKINSEIINRIIPFAKNAVYYGYMYRVEYEKQVEENGLVTTKYSLLAPSDYYELLAAFALSGYIGGVTNKIVKYIGVQIKDFINKEGNGEESEKEIIDLIEDETQLRKFVKYVIDYYKGYPIGIKAVSEAIIEEEFADYASHEKGEEFGNALKNMTPENRDEILGLFTDIANGAAKKRKESIPNKEDLKNLFLKTKKELKKELEKENKKELKKKTKNAKKKKY